ncbi:F0F1 ATP synthase subunit A [Candidatus Uhrbacteria bacterium]|nr:F0F1 ATP synthase subunit A [Candidatus Uhrbacteria bacterium]
MNIPIAAEPIFEIGHFTVTNAYINSSLVTLLIVIFAFSFSRGIKRIPGKLQSAVESLIEFLLGYFDQVTGSRVKSLKFLPLVGTLFIFILLSNWIGLLPGTGSIGRWLMMHGEIELVPILRPSNSDLNMTLAMALVSVIASHVIGMFTLGFFVHWNKFIQLGGLWKAIVSLKPMNLVTAVVQFGVGLLELVSEVAKILSLSLRLFGNIFAGEVLMTVISSMVSFFVPLPFIALELIVGVIQATVFSMLTLVYLTTMTTSHEAHDEGHGEKHHVEPAPAT